MPNCLDSNAQLLSISLMTKEEDNPIGIGKYIFCQLVASWYTFGSDHT